jgi:hypothetical protein
MTRTLTGLMWGCLSAKRQIRRLISSIALRGHCPSLLPTFSVVPRRAHRGQSRCEQAENASLRSTPRMQVQVLAASTDWQSAGRRACMVSMP